MNNRIIFLSIFLFRVFLAQETNITNKEHFVISYHDYSELDIQLSNLDSLQTYDYYNGEFYQDDLYEITWECKGEFGGNVFFKNKNSNQITIASSLCPSKIFKIKNSYYLISTIWHLCGSINMDYIKNPKKLKKFENSNKDENYLRKIRKSRKGQKQLYNSNICEMILLNFEFNNQIFFVISGDNGTYISKFQNGKMIKIQEVSTEKWYSVQSITIQTKDGRYINKLNNGNWSKIGNIIFEDNELKIYIKKK